MWRDAMRKRGNESIDKLSREGFDAGRSKLPARTSEGAVNSRARSLEGQRGMALITVLLIMSLLLMLGLAVTFTSVSDKAITSNFKNLTSGFYAAEAGVNNLHRLLRNDKFIMGSLPDPPRVSVGQPTLNPDAFVTTAEQVFNTTENFPNNASYRTKIKIANIQVPYPAGDNDPAHSSNKIKYINPLYPGLGQVEP